MYAYGSTCFFTLMLLMQTDNDVASALGIQGEFSYIGTSCILFMIKFSLSFTFYVLCLSFGELFPVLNRVTCVGFIYTISKFSTIISPTAAALKQPFPNFVLLLTSFVATFLCLFIHMPTHNPLINNNSRTVSNHTTII